MKQNRVRAFVRTLLVLAMAMFGARTASAQFGKIDGHVKAADGKPLQDATVVIVGQQYSAVTNKDGYYYFVNVPVAVYTLRVTKIGYTAYVVNDLRVSTNQTNTADFTLPAQGAVTLGEITTTAGTSLVNRNKDASTQTLDAEYTKNLPETRISSLLALQPGVARPLDGDTNRLSIRGARYDNNVTYLDGVPQQRLTSNGADLDIAANAFEDVSLTTGPASAQFGNALGGIINISTRNGGTSYRTTLQWDTGMLGGKYATGSNSFSLNFGGPVPFINGLSFNTSARLDGTAWTNNGYHGWLFPQYSTVGIDTTFTVPRANNISSNTFNNSRADSIHYNVYKTAVYSGDCDNFSFVKNAATQEMRDNYGVDCNLNRTFVSPRTNYAASGSVSYRFGGSTLRASYNWSGTQLRARLLTDGRQTGTITNSGSAQFNWTQTLFRKGTHSLSIDATYSIQNSNNTVSPITVESEKSSRHPFSGFLLKKLDLVYNKSNFPIDSTVIKAVLTQSTYRTSLNGPGSSTGSQSAASVGSATLGDGVPYRDANGGGAGDASTFTWSYENRKVLQVNLDAQVDRWNRLTFGGSRTTTDAKNFSGSTTSSNWFQPELAALYAEDKLDLSDVVVTGGVRWDYFNYHLKRWNNYPRISSLPGFDKKNPDLLMVLDKSHDYLAPHVNVAFPVTQTTNFRLGYSQQVQSPSLPNVATRHNLDIARSGINNRGNFGDDIGFSKSIKFEFGVQHAFSDNMVIDVDFNNTDNLANSQFKFAKRIDPLSGEPQQLYLLQNTEFGNSRGVEISLDRQIGNWLNGRLNYSYQDTKNTSSDINSFISFFEGIITGDGEPPATPISIATSRPHTLNGTMTFTVPSDFKRGSILGKVFAKTIATATFQLQSGTPYTRCDPNLQANLALTSGTNNNCSSLDAVQGYQQSRLPMTKSFNMRFSRAFNIGKVGFSAYLTVNNILNLQNTTAVYATTGTTSNPALFLDQFRADSQTFLNAAAAHGFQAGTSMVLPTSTAGCAKVSNTTTPLVQSCFYWIRSEQRFGNGDGIYTLDEWRNVSKIRHLPDSDISQFVTGFRSMRFGVRVEF